MPKKSIRNRLPKSVKVPITKVLNSLGYYSVRDPFEVQAQLVKGKEPVVFDVGARFGVMMDIYRDRFPGAHIHCFEPFPESFDVLQRNVNGARRTSCYQIALADKNGTALLNSNPESGTNSLLTTDKRAASFWGEGMHRTMAQVEVPTTTIDDFCHKMGITQIDILKIDVQGFEYSVLAGAKNMLSRQKISLIYTELITCPTYTGQHKMHEYLSFLDSFDYQPLDFFHQIHSCAQLIQTDVIFLSGSFKQQIEDLLPPARPALV
jgi:FkbM family methyltransferase